MGLRTSCPQVFLRGVQERYPPSAKRGRSEAFCRGEEHHFHPVITDVFRLGARVRKACFEPPSGPESAPVTRGKPVDKACAKLRPRGPRKNSKDKRGPSPQHSLREAPSKRCSASQRSHPRPGLYIPCLATLKAAAQAPPSFRRSGEKIWDPSLSGWARIESKKRDFRLTVRAAESNVSAPSTEKNFPLGP